MKNSDFFNKGLPKWPALIVVGDKVTKEQAAEIIVRTDNLRFSTNDHEFASQLYELVYGVTSNKQMYHISLYDYFDGDNKWEKCDKLKQEVISKYRILEGLEYLNNNQIVSSWIGGPHGWCSWDGFIGCNNYNIGKYPDVKTIYTEWRIIAREFPFLNLKSQLLNGETCSDNLEPVVQFNVSKGKVKMTEPTKLLQNTRDIDFIGRMLNPYGERGCAIDQLKEALNLIKEK